MPNCLFCGCSSFKRSLYEDTFFNEKIFNYLSCKKCGLIYVNPLPNADDLIKMYPLEYQGALATKTNGSYNNLFQKIKDYGKYSNILDFGCGGGRFVVEAINKGYNVTGVEFNPKLVLKLQKTFPNAQFHTIDEFNSKRDNYDIIFLSNVLEHLTNPKEIMGLLLKKLALNGIIILEGPVENNFSLSKLVLNSLFFTRKVLFNKKLNHTPTHVFYSNQKNQLQFFKSLKLKTIYYHIDEHAWPFPSNYSDCKTFQNKLKYFIAVCSIKIGKKISCWGNNFVYIGRK